MGNKPKLKTFRVVFDQKKKENTDFIKLFITELNMNNKHHSYFLFDSNFYR